MKEEKAKDIFLILYLLIVLVLTVVYFFVPERKIFIENTIKWWSELWDIIKQ